MEKQQAVQLVKYLLGTSQFDLSSISDSEMLGAGLAVFSHRRMIKTKELNAFLRDFKRRQLHEAVEDGLTWQTYTTVDQILEKENFNFRFSEVNLDAAPEVMEALKRKTLTARISSEKVQSYIDRHARHVVDSVQQACPSAVLDLEEIKGDLQVHLIGPAEKRYDPVMAAYATFAYSVLEKRAKSLIRTLKNAHAVIVTSVNQEVDGEPCSIEEIHNPDLDERLTAVKRLNKLLCGLTPLERFSLYCFNVLDLKKTALCGFASPKAEILEKIDGKVQFD